MELTERLEHYLHNELSPDEAAQLEREMERDADLRRTLESLRISERAVLVGAARNDVRQAHAQFMTQLRTERTRTDAADGPEIIPLNSRQNLGGFGWVTRIAASVLLAVVGYGGYQVATLNEQTIYKETFVRFQLPTTRGSADRPSPLETPYRAGDFAGVVRQAAALPTRQIPDNFLTAMAHLQLNQYGPAIAYFEQVRAANTQRATTHFGAETDYYLALAYLGAKQYKQAYALFDRIRQDVDHPYHDFLSKMDLWKLKVLELKE